jgi:hypothetical protein
MTPRAFEQSNWRLTRPSDMTDEQCGELEVFTDGEHCISCWEPMPEERAAIAAGAPVWLWVHSGRTQPPVSLSTDHPFAEAVTILPEDSEYIRSRKEAAS